ncbi:MAG: FtsQ-type POTRA domain-containing protein [Saccharospirillaceae bacterium]|nr:FtsQ-type POTRA domain-containing protein [Saccharospirillaceae bacterium]MCD8530050.1 FtsQ-type POTRA domain-containing protein [Saccharospirillaceae bacterium]
MAKKAAPRGATPVIVKQPRQWRVTMPVIAWQWLLVPCLLAGLLAGMRWGYQSWPMSNVEVKGRLSVWNPEDIAERIVWVKDESFFSLDLQKVYEQLSGLPLIMQVTVRKRWPGTLELTVYEDVPMAIWNNDQLLSANGRLSEIPAHLDAGNLARIDGDHRYAEEAVRHFRRIQQSLMHLNVGINRLTVSAVGAVDVELSNGWQVRFGRQYFEERVQRLELLIAQLPENAVVSVDLRYGKGAAIGWRPVQEMG